ncbi:MAG: S24 family peptidase [Flavobacteriaceae bacterium]
MKIVRLPKFGLELINLAYKKVGNTFVTYYDEGVQAGFPSPADDFKEHKLSLDERYFTNPDATFLIKVVGNSMYPTLHVDDILIVKSDIDFTNDKIGIISVNNTDFTVKRYNKKREILIADNKEFSNIKIEEEDTLLCLGVVAHLIRDIV